MVPRAGLEPARANAHQILSLARLPIPPPRHERTLQTTVEIVPQQPLANQAPAFIFYRFRL